MSSKLGKMWPQPQEIHSVGGDLCITNTTDQPILLQKHQNFRQILDTSTANQQVPYSHIGSPNKATSPIKPFSKSVSIDPSNSLPSDIRQILAAINLKYDEVFNPRIAKYNGASAISRLWSISVPFFPHREKVYFHSIIITKCRIYNLNLISSKKLVFSLNLNRSILLLNI